MKANLATSLIAYARGGVRKQLLVLCLLTLCAGNMWGGASWIGKSYIVVNRTWYNADGTGQSNNFDGYNLGHLTSLTLGGEVQTYGQSDGYNNSATMGYQISGQSASSMTLYWYQYKENNNWFHSASGKSSDFAANTINISGLTPGEYTLSVWFYQADGGVYDSNSNNNYVATFYIDPTITFDQQSGTGGTSSITGPWGAAMPSITLPKRAGKKFEGYYTGQNGTGTQYYAYNGNSVHTCDFTSNPTLYANWKTPTEYTFYYAAPSDIVADNTVKCYVNYGYDQGSADVNMTATNMTYNNKRIYSVTVTANYQSFDGIYFKPKGWSGDGSEEQAANTSYVAASEINGKIYEHGVGWQTYAEDASYTVYYVNTNNWTTPKAYAWSSDYDKSVVDYASSAAMTKTDYTYNGHDIYTITYTRGFTNVIFNDNASESAKTGNLECYANRDKLYNGSTWQAYGRDITIYVVPEAIGYTSGTTYDPSTHNTRANVKVGDDEWLASWPIFTKTSYKYKSHWIYEARVLAKYNVIKTIQFWVFSGDDKVASNSYYDCTPASQYVTSDIDGKIFVGWYTDHHQWDVYGTDVELDQQSGSAGTESVTATVGSPMPAITLPGRDGYAFGGYWTKTNGGGTQYYNSDGSSTRNWDSKTITTLYAKWTAREYTVKLEDMEPTTAGQGSVSVTFDASDNMTSAVTQPTKTHYDFRGYWTDNNDSGATLGEPLIDENGNWIKKVSPYTGSDADGNPTWIYPNDISLFAKWEEHPYTIDLVVSPEGAGTTSPSSSTTGKFVTASGDITASPAAGWKFKEWQFSKTGEDYDVYVSDGNTYHSTDPTIRIKAQHDGTLTAVFEPRFCLVGSIWDDSDNGGMPGWKDYTKTFTVKSSSPVDLTCTCTLQANKTYKLQVRDLATSTNLGRSGCDPVCVLEENTSLVMENSDNDVFLYTSGAGEYIFKITAVDGSGHPTLTVLRPYQVNIGRKRVDIDGNDHDDNTGGTVDLSKQTAPETWTPISNGDWVPYGISVKYNASKEDGYTLDWYTASDYATQFSTEPYWFHTATSTGNGYAKFTEKSTSVTLSNDGHGKIQIGGIDATSTTCGVTTTRELTAVPNEGYKFSSWSKSGDDITLSSSSTNPTTLSGNGSGATSGQTLTANFEERYSIKGTMNGENWGTTHTLSNIGTNAGSKDTCYVTMTLPANTTYEFAIYDEQTGDWYKAGSDRVYYMTYTNHTNWEFGDTKTYNCGITTAGKGTYKFIFNITDKTVTVVYPTSYQVNYGASPSVGGNITVVDDDSQAVSNGGYVRSGGSVTYTAAAASGYTFVGWCGSDEYGETFNTELSWTHSSVAATSNSYAKFKSTNFVIYRTGDISSDPRAAYDDVESYTGGTISETIEFRMKVNELDYWYTLCLPFEVNDVQVWDEVDGAYYEIVPYWRTEGKYYTGHYILRKPVTTTNYAIETFEKKWEDPDNSGVRPEKNIPYIIQWHDEYFQDKYISFLGAAGQEIPTAMDNGSYASSDETVNIYGNNSMTTGTVRDAYLLDPYYGTDGAWMREEIGTDRSVLPFECFIRANPATTAKYRVLRRDMADDTPTGLDTLSKTEDTVSKVLINNRIYIIRGGKMYTIQGTCVKEVE